MSPINMFGVYYLMIGVLNVIIYSFVLIVIVRFRREFNSSFYLCVIALGVSDVYILSYVDIYGGVCQLLGLFPFGETVDAVLAAVQYCLWYNTLLYHAFLAVNRFTAIVFYRQYSRLLRPKVSACLLSFGSLFGPCVVLFGQYLQGYTLQYNFNRTFATLNPRNTTYADNFFRWTYLCGLGLVCVLVPIYVIAFVVAKYRTRALSHPNKCAFGKEVKMLIQGSIMASGLVLMYAIPLTYQLSLFWIHFIFDFYVGVNPYLYLIFNKKLRQKCGEILHIRCGINPRSKRRKSSAPSIILLKEEVPAEVFRKLTISTDCPELSCTSHKRQSLSLYMNTTL